MQRTLACFAALAFVSAAACGGKAFDPGAGPDPTADAGPDAVSPDAAPDANDGSAGRCIPPSATPACCMSFGGWSADGVDTTSACDNLPDPGAPGWSIETDSHGCSYWVPPVGAAIACTGAPPVTCCPIDDKPNCCMRYGGSEASKLTCVTVCDGMPGPGYAGWEKRIDSNGCPYWYTPPDAPHECGVPRVDAGPTDPPEPDSGVPQPSDAGAP